MCMVFELLGSSIAKQTTTHSIERLPARAVRQITRQLLLALDFIQTECQIIHTDISPQNICLELACTHETVAKAQADANGDIELATPSLLHSPAFSVRLNDFGIACFTTQHLTDQISPPLLRAPEITLAAPWDASVDVFNLGALVLQFVTGELPFPGKGHRNTRWCHESDRLAQLVRNFGRVPGVVLDEAERKEEFETKGVDLRSVKRGVDTHELEHFVADCAGVHPGDEEGEVGVGAEEERNWDGVSDGDRRADGLPMLEVGEFCDLLRRMLATDPRRRETPRALLQHPWLNRQD